MPKYDSNSKRQRDAELLAYAKKHPDYSQKEIGGEFGLSSQRVSVILRKNGIKQRG